MASPPWMRPCRSRSPASTARTRPKFAASARTLVTSLLGTGHPSVALVADAAGMNVRTFQRRLADKDLVYAQVVPEIRLAEASRRLVETDQRITDIALEGD